MIFRPFKKIKQLRVTLSRYETKIRQLEKEYNEELELILHDMKEIIPCLLDLNIRKSNEGINIIVSVALDPMMITQCLSPTDNLNYLQHMSKYIGDMILRELRTANLARFKEDVFLRGRTKIPQLNMKWKNSIRGGKVVDMGRKKNEIS